MKESIRNRVYYNDSSKQTAILMMLFVFNAVILTILSVSQYQHEYQKEIQKMKEFQLSSSAFFRKLVDEEGADEDDEYQAEIIVFDDDDDERQKQMTKDIAWYHLDRYLERNTLLYDLAEGFLYVADGFFIMWVILGCMVRFGCLSKENWDESLFFGGGGLNQKFMRRRRYKRIHDGRGVFAPVPTNIDEDGYYYDDNDPNDDDGEDDEDNFSQASRESMEYGTCSTVVSVSSKKSVRSYVSTGGKSLDNRSLVSTKSAPGGIITGDDDYYGNKQIDIRKEAMKLVKEAENYFKLGDRKAQQRKEKKEEMDALGLLLDLEMAEVPIIHPKVSNRKPKQQQQQEQTGMIITTTTADDSTNNNNNNNPSTTTNDNNNSNINTTTNDDDDSDSDDSDVVVFV